MILQAQNCGQNSVKHCKRKVVLDYNFRFMNLIMWIEFWKIEPVLKSV